jgi:transposase InsO family protein
MCRALGLSRSGHHAFGRRKPSRRKLAQQKLDVLVAALFAEMAGNYGSPRIQQELARRGHDVDRKSVAASMVRQKLVARRRRRWRTTTNSKHKEPIAPNLVNRVFTVSAPNKVWVADTTYLPVLGGFLFLVAVIDLFSRKVVGWSLGDSLDAELSGLALRRALARRQPGRGLVFHSDRGIEFAAKSFRKILAEARMVQSMSRKGNCWDNAVAESFSSTLEFEGPDTSTWRYVNDGEPELFRFIEGYYNQKRIHSHNNYKTPNEVESEDLRNGVRAA